jgi:hypothetical protein
MASNDGSSMMEVMEPILSLYFLKLEYRVYLSKNSRVKIPGVVSTP